MTPHTGYRPFTKVLHWVTVAALAAQFVVGYTMDADSSGRGRGRGRSGESGRGRGRGGDDGYDIEGLLVAHVALGVTILVLAVARLLWRRSAGLPPWAPQLSGWQRTFAHRTEQVLYLLLFVIPLSGLWLVFVSEDAIGVHVAAHLAFFAALVAHLGLVLGKRLLPRML